jgi:hypothetical protein
LIFPIECVSYQFDLYSERQSSIFYLVVIASVDVTAHSEIGDFDGQTAASGSFTHQTIAARQVAMDEVLRREIGHPVCDLGRDRVQILLLSINRIFII